jgi:hypothetical protein
MMHGQKSIRVVPRSFGQWGLEASGWSESKDGKGKGKGKAILVQAGTGSEYSRMLRLPDFET